MEDKYLQRFEFLVDAHKQASVRHEHEFGSTFTYIVGADWHQWFTSALGLLGLVFGEGSPHHRNLQRFYDRPGDYYKSEFDAALGVFAAAKSDYEGGYYLSLNRTIAGEVFADFVGLAKKALEEGNKDVAAVLACAALEDALKRYAALNDLDVQDQSMQQVVAALKSKGLVSGPQKLPLTPPRGLIRTARNELKRVFLSSPYWTPCLRSAIMPCMPIGTKSIVWMLAV